MVFVRVRVQLVTMTVFISTNMNNHVRMLTSISFPGSVLRVPLLVVSLTIVVFGSVRTSCC